MQKKFLGSIKNQNKKNVLLVFVFILLGCAQSAVETDIESPIHPQINREKFITDNTELLLPNGISLQTKKTGKLSSTLILKKKNRLVWKKQYEEAFDSLWHYAYFVPILKNQYYSDVNDDGYIEVAVGIWDGGNSPCRKAHIFSIREKSLKYIATRDTGSEQVVQAWRENCRDPRFQ